VVVVGEREDTFAGVVVVRSRGGASGRRGGSSCGLFVESVVAQVVVLLGAGSRGGSFRGCVVGGGGGVSVQGSVGAMCVVVLAELVELPL
jgi:hypothetical protein